jgi:NadR type nicotinamide-nucleotide adenylyltransferase
MSPLIVAVTGPESSGKSVLSAQLAEHFDAPKCEEYAREYLENTGGKYFYEDLDLICRGQLKLQEETIKQAGKLAIFDTDMLVLYVWSKFRFGKVSPVIDSALKQSSVDLYLLCKPDIEWTPDPFRESPNQTERDAIFELYEQYLKNVKARYVVISGTFNTRLQSGTNAVASLLHP